MQLDNAMLALRLQLYRQGMGDGELAVYTDATLHVIRHWRRAAGLKANGANRGKVISRSEHAKRRNMYRLGWSDARIGRASGTRGTAIQKWRTKSGLPPVGTGYEIIVAAAEDVRMKLYRRGLRDSEICRETGLSLSAIFSWRLRRGLPRNEAERNWKRPSTSFVSLDAERGEGGLNLHGVIADDAAADWLEEHGATVW